MPDWITREPPELKHVAERLHRSAPLTLKKLMGQAGLTAQSLGYWRTGRSTPQPESIEKVAVSLLLHSARLQAMGNELLSLAQEEELRRREHEGQNDEDESLNLFEQVAP